jgi:spoIIIJ-associated protein
VESGRSGESAIAGNTVETSARTVEEAIAKSLTQLGRSRDEVEIEVLHEGSPGRLLGFGAEPARVRVSVVGDAAMASASLSGDSPPIAPARAPATLPSVPGGAIDIALPDAGDEGEPGAEADEEDTEERRAGDAEMTRLMLAELLNRMGLRNLRVEVVGLTPITLNVRGGEFADLIGRRGENLRALQFIVNLMANKQLRRHLRVVVDVDGYRARREELLRTMATRLAQRVRVTHQPLRLEAMPPNERRIVHLALAEDPDVTTESTGEGDARRVVLKPRR